MKKLLTFLSLFTSVSTLICCALPALFVTLGMGAVFAGLVSNIPQLIWLSERKLWLFGIGAVLLAAGGYLQWNARFEPCPIDAEQAKACMSARRTSKIIYFVSVAIYLIGAFFAFVAQYLI